MDHDSLLKTFESIPAHVNENAHLVHRGRFLNAQIKLGIGDSQYWMQIRAGRIDGLSQKMPLFQTSDLQISATDEAWAALWEQFPKAGWHDLFALHKRGVMKIEGESQLLFSNLQYLKDVLNTPRQFHGA